MTSPNDIFAQFPIADAICAHLDRNSDLLAFASACKGTAAMREACVEPRLRDRTHDFVDAHFIDIVETCKQRNISLDCCVSVVRDCVYETFFANLCVRIYKKEIFIADRYFNWGAWHVRCIPVRRTFSFPTFKSLLHHLIGATMVSDVKYVWTSPS